jgi:two-component system, OmpR family, sensor histidine kinase BaeS
VERLRIRSITLKMTLAFLVIALISSALLALFARQETQRNFDQFVKDQGQINFIDSAAAYYESNGSWSGFANYIQRRPREQQAQDNGQQSTNGQPSSNSQQSFPPQNLRPPKPFLLVDTTGSVVWPAGPYHVGDQVSQDELSRGTPVQANNQTVGYVLTTAVAPELDPTEQQYLDRTNQALLKAALGATLVAVLLGFVLARTITTPLRELTAAIRAMARGRLNQALPVRSRDELGDLTVAFNQMSMDLARANDLRRQMTADIAHDLRTPLSVITGYLESLRDGVLKPTTERLTILYSEAQHLNHLVDDLRTLSLADANELPMNRQLAQPVALMERLAAVYRHPAGQRNVTLNVECDDALPDINIDVERMAQVVGNLVSNALRYTPEGGRITLSARRESAGVVLAVSDTGAGISPDVLPHVFERFYRGDKSRVQSSQESGLGLAIAKSIVDLHGGRISAASDGAGQGSTFSIQLPAA